MKHIFIINPVSGRNRKMNIEDRIRKECTKREMEFEIYITTQSGDAKRKVLSLKDEESCVVYAVGGDGTLNEVVNGIIGTDHMLGVIPSGSGNDFYRTLVKHGKNQFNCDVGKINDRYFINIACIGIDAEIANNVPNMKKYHVPVSQLYNASIIYTFFKYKFKKLLLQFGELTKKSDFTIVTVCNGQFYGGGFRLAPHAIINDGQFEIYAVDKMPKLFIVPLLLKIKSGKHEEHEKVKRYADNKITIISDEVISCNIDGEPLQADRVDIEIVKNAITVYNNKGFVQSICCN